MQKIAQIKSCTASVIFDKLKYCKIPTRKSFDPVYYKYPRIKFTGNPVEKAYLIGFRLGDLYARRLPYGVYIKTNTTRFEQVSLLKELFEKYGHLSIRSYADQFQIEVRLHKTFSFLVEKDDDIPSWIVHNHKYFLAFIGGYTDAEGNIGIYSNRARFRLGSYDKNILYLILLFSSLLFL